MTFQLKPTRRRFLQTAVAAIAYLILPKSLRANRKAPSYWFVHADGNSWQVADPVLWSLASARQPVLERARDGLLKLTAADGKRIIRLVTRRCRLNLLELQGRRVIVHHWGQQGMVELRPFFKTHGLALRGIKVVVKERKREVATLKTGDDFLFGERLASHWMLRRYERKWRARFDVQPDDGLAAPGTWSGYAWEGLESNRIPWAAMKSAWRRAAPRLCLNCDTPTFLANFGFPWQGMFNRYPSFFHACGTCRRTFEDDSVKDVKEWIALNLDAEVRPNFDMVWDRRKNLEWADERFRCAGHDSI
jgi:hypothetical protein